MSEPAAAESLPGSFAQSWADATVFSAAFEALVRAGVTVHQRKSEISRFCALVQELKPRRVLEIGTAEGGTIALLALAAAHDATIVTIDVNPCRTAVPLRGLQRLVLVRGDSGDPVTRQEVLQVLPECDVLFIDADHNLAERDFDLYGPCVVPGGIVAFHDICPDPPGPGNSGRTPAFWRELAAKQPRTCEIIETPGQKAYGIGVLFV